MRHLCLVLTVCLLLGLPLLGQDEDTRFVNDVMQKGASNDALGVMQLILAHPDQAEHAFNAVYSGYAGLSDPDQKQRAQKFLNVTARVLDSVGRHELLNRLKADNLLLEWHGASPSPSPGAAAQSNQLFSIYLTAMDRSMRYGNFQAATRVIASFDEFARQLLSKKPDTAKSITVIHTAMEALRLCSLMFGGQQAAAIKLGQELLQSPDLLPSVRLCVHMSLLEAGVRASRPALVDQYLEDTLKDIQASTDESVPVYLFMVRTFAFQRELDRHPDLPEATYLKRHQEAWGSLGSYRVPEKTSTLDGRFLWDATSFWLNEELKHVRESPPGAGRQWEELVAQDHAKAAQVSQTSTAIKDARNFNPEFLVRQMDWWLDTNDLLLSLGKTDGVQEMIDRVEVFWKKVAEFAPLAYAQYQRDQQLMEIIRLQGYKVDPKPFDFDLTQGDISRLEARIHQQRIRLVLVQAEGHPMTGAQGQVIIKELPLASEAQARAVQGQGYQGLEDIRWDILRVLFRLRLPGWQDQAALALGEIQKDCNKLQFRPGIIAAWSYLGELEATRKNLPTAIEDLKKATGLAEEYISEVGTTAAGAAKLRQRYQRAYDLLARLQIEAGTPGDAFETLGRQQQMQTLTQASAQISEPSLSRASTLRGQTQSLQLEIAQGKASGQDTKPAEQLLAQTKGEFHTTLDDIRRHNPKYESLLAIRPVNFSKQQSYIPTNAALVQYFPADDALYVFVVTRTDLKIHKVQVGEGEIRKLVAAFRRSLLLQRDGSAPASFKDDKSLQEADLRLYKILYEPVEKDVADKALVAFIPTGVLNYLPFPALASSRPDGGMEFLAEKKQCVTLLKSSDVEQLSRPPVAGKGSMLALGNPDGSLPAAAGEVKEVAGLFGSTPYLGQDATRDHLASLKAGAGVGYVHLATHGHLQSDQPSSSFLLMAGAGDGAQLRVSQIYDLKLDGVRLVTLSACQTAVGERDPGSELTTLAEAFSIAGSNSVVASLWSVEDQSTQQLMVEFYQRIKAGKSLAESLQSAELKLIRGGKFSHPFYWAPFVLIGDWR